MNQNYQLKFFSLNDNESRASYNDYLVSLDIRNAYYSIEHLSHLLSHEDELVCFMLMKEQQPILFYPVIKRIIPSELEDVYYDITTGYGYNGPLYNEAAISADDLSVFWTMIDDWYKKNNIVSEFVRFNLNGNHQNYTGTLVPSLLNVRGNLLDDFETQWAAFNSKVRNNYRKSVTYNLKFSIFHGDSISKAHIVKFYAVYLKTMKRRNAKSIYFFSEKHFIDLITSNPHSYTIAFTCNGDQSISTELLINYKQQLFAYLGGTDADYFFMRPNDFLRVEVIKWAISNKIISYTLGGGIEDGDQLYKSKKPYFPKDEDAQYYTGRKIINEKFYYELANSNGIDTGIEEKENLELGFFPVYRSPLKIV